MSSWRAEYLAALQARDAREQANKEVYDAYTRLADRAASLSTTPGPKVPKSEKKEKAGQTVASTSVAVDVSAAQVRQNLAEAQRSRGELETRIVAVTSELEKLQLKSTMDSRRITELAMEKSNLVKKLRDRDEELRGKSKLLEDVHDETLSLTIELNMAEDTNKKLKLENQELVDRWMARKGQEAEAMNTASKF
ncbi:hypothetical protein MMC34_000334 [Xylographa carneopallida]|nr:hypothetical protein [Xylographa carneopallida]